MHTFHGVKVKGQPKLRRCKRHFPLHTAPPKKKPASRGAKLQSIAARSDVAVPIPGSVISEVTGLARARTTPKKQVDNRKRPAPPSVSESLRTSPRLSKRQPPPASAAGHNDPEYSEKRRKLQMAEMIEEYDNEMYGYDEDS